MTPEEFDRGVEGWRRPLTDQDLLDVPGSLVTQFPGDLAAEDLILPLWLDERSVHFAMTDPFDDDKTILADMSFHRIARNPQHIVTWAATAEQIRFAIEWWYQMTCDELSESDRFDAGYYVPGYTLQTFREGVRNWCRGPGRRRKLVINRPQSSYERSGVED